MEKVAIRDGEIKLQAFLKFANAVATGGEAKMLIVEGNVSVNGEICTMRGKKLHPGDVVSLGEDKYQVCSE